MGKIVFDHVLHGLSGNPLAPLRKEQGITGMASLGSIPVIPGIQCYTAHG